jgi:photosystem II stability/assembly factor-like uncharacterized protein
VQKLYLCFVFLFTTCFANAQWKKVALNYQHTKRPEFFIPLSMHFSDTANGFLLTSSTLMQLKTNYWQPVNTGDPAAFSYTNVFTVDSINTFLCGWDGKVSKFNGDTLAILFTLNESEITNPLLNTIFMIDSTHGWAAGEGGTLIQIDGGSHTVINMPASYSFSDIYFNTPNHGWMIGMDQEHVEDGGLLFECVDGTWSVYSTTSGQAYDIEFSSPENGFITTQQDIYRYNSITNEWLPENISGYYRQYHLSMLNDNYGISVSDNNQNMVYQDGVWSPGPAASVADLVNIKTTAPGKAWALSQIGNNNSQDLNDGKIQLLENNEWASLSLKYLDTVSILPLDVAVTSINGFDKKNIWFDGQYFNLPADKDWPDSTPSLISDTFCTALKIFSTNFGLALNGDLLEWTGQRWINKNIDPFINPDTSVANICMHVFDDTTGFICRQLFVWSSSEIKNVIARYDYQTNSLTTSVVLGSRYPYAIHFSDKQNGWCAGDSGLLVKYANGNWETMPDITNKRLNSVFTVDPLNAWAVGDEGTLLKYNGTEWEEEELPTEQNLHGIYFVNCNNGWLVGDSGLIFRYNGTEWTQDTTGVTNALYSIFMVDSAYGFVGGDTGTILQFVKQSPPPPAVRKFCEFGDTYFSFYADGSSYSYKWQIDSTNGFENLIEDAIFSGTTTDTLKLTAVPPTFYGYKFRCIASFEGVDTSSNVEELKFINRWTGDVSTAWEDSGNWSCGSLPGENTDVIITSGEIILNSQTSIRSLTVLPGVNITIAEGAALNIRK